MWPWALTGVLAIIGTVGGLAYTGEIPIPHAAYGIRFAQNWLPVHTSELHVGDIWVYESSFSGVSDEGDVMTQQGTLEYRVTAMDGDRVTVAVTSSSGLTSFIYDRQGNLIENQRLDTSGNDFSRASHSFDPPLHWYSFPLTTGKTWQTTSTGDIKAFSDWYNYEKKIESGKPNAGTVIVKVLGWERDIGTLDDVPVDGLKMRTEIIDSNGKPVHNATEWYVPAAGRSVLQKIEFTYGYKNSATRRLTNFTPSDPTNATGKE